MSPIRNSVLPSINPLPLSLPHKPRPASCQHTIQGQAQLFFGPTGTKAALDCHSAITFRVFTALFVNGQQQNRDRIGLVWSVLAWTFLEQGADHSARGSGAFAGDFGRDLMRNATQRPSKNHTKTSSRPSKSSQQASEATAIIDFDGIHVPSVLILICPHTTYLRGHG